MLAHAHVDVMMHERDLLFVQAQQRLAGVGIGLPSVDVDGVRHLTWAQVVEGVAVIDADLRANVTRDGRLINVLGGLRGGARLDSAVPAVSAGGRSSVNSGS